MEPIKVRCGLDIRCALLSLLATACFAQLHSVDIKVGGLDCASCATSVESRLKRIRGVESSKFDAERGVASVTLTPDNRVTLNAIRDALKGIGYTPGDADIVVSGTVKGDKLSLPHQPDAFVLDKAVDGQTRVTGKVPAGTNRLTAVEPARSGSPRPPGL
jgi:copper chaperone CopZ